MVPSLPLSMKKTLIEKNVYSYKTRFMFIPLAYQIWKTLKAISNQRVSSKYRVEPESIKSNDDILNWLSIVWNVTPSF